MAIYKQVMPEHHVNKDQIKHIASDHESDVSVQIQHPDEAYEYFSDKEEAEKHRKRGKQNPRIS